MRSSLPELSLKIIDLVHDHGQVSLADVVKATNANRNTAKKRLGELVAGGYLVSGGKAKGSWYSLA
jgi:DNA-binding IclR family transcriptional regulator